MGEFTAAVFDLDGTLFDSMGFWRNIDEWFLNKMGIDEVPEDYLLAIAHLGAEETAKYTKERFKLDISPEEMMKCWFDEALDFYRTRVTLKPGAYDFLRILRDGGVKLAVATASDAPLYRPGLERTGIDGFFGAFATVNECERKKGFPDVYSLACSRLGVPDSEAVVFEDIYIAVKGAKAGGFRTVGVFDEVSCRDAEAIEKTADLFICDFTELLQETI
ncbi:MAG: HAD family phosphatase [Ruminiclostridium sp.]|nr:HAD family phosphatase [Ruminiclostridium sp.]